MNIYGFYHFFLNVRKSSQDPNKLMAMSPMSMRGISVNIQVSLPYVCLGCACTWCLHIHEVCMVCLTSMSSAGCADMNVSVAYTV